jgi:uncharacterized HAD superfamily protein
MSAIGVDVDGVLADFINPFITMIRKHTTVSIPDVSWTYPDEWDFHLAAGVTPEENDRIWKDIKTSSFFYNLPRLPQALATLRKLTDLERCGHAVYFITARPGRWAKQGTEHWLTTNGYAPGPTVLIADDKGPLARALKLDIFIDDRPENCMAVAQATTTCRVFMVDAPYNRHERIHDVTNVASALAALQECEGYLNGLSEQQAAA